MRKAFVGLIAAVALMSAFTVLVIAQEGGMGQFQPFTIAIQHEEPITVTSATTAANGEIVTVTTPITIGVDLRINVEGPDIIQVASDGATVSDVAVELVIAEPEPDGMGGFVDASGRTYVTEAPAGVTVGQVQSKETVLGSEFFGRITNDGEDTLSTVFVTVQVFDADGLLLGVETGIANLDEIAPGQASPFQALSQIPYDDVASYVIQVEP